MKTEGLLRKASQALATAAGTGVLAGVFLVAPVSAYAQYSVSDSQLQAGVIAALHNDQKLGTSNITAAASQGVVTLTGTAPDQDALVEAEQVAAGVSGVRSIQDNVKVAGGGQAASGAAPVAPVQGEQAQNDQAENNQTQDNQAQNNPQNNQAQNEPAQNNQAENNQGGAMPPPPPAEPGTAASGMPPPPPSDQQAQQGETPYPNGSAAGQPPQNGYPNQAQQNGYPNQQNGYPNQQNGYPNQGGGYPDQQGGYEPRGNAHPPTQGPVLAVTPQRQNNSGPVGIAPGTLLSVRTTQPLSTANLKGGEYFQVTAAADLYVNGVVAVPRGALLTGQVVEAKNAGAFGGSPKLDLKLTSIQLGPTTYPVVSDVWSSQGPSKTGYTATNAAGGAIFGALIGAIAGGGVGAGVGAVAGGATGAAVSGATRGPRLTLPPEALLQFHIEQPLTVQPMPYDEAERLAASVPQQPVLHQRPVYPYPYPYPYAVRPYPY